MLANQPIAILPEIIWFFDDFMDQSIRPNLPKEGDKIRQQSLVKSLRKSVK